MTRLEYRAVACTMSAMLALPPGFLAAAAHSHPGVAAIVAGVVFVLGLGITVWKIND